MDEEQFDKQVSDLTLALLYLTRFKERGDVVWRSWKGYDFDALNGLADQDLIRDNRHRSKSVLLMEDGIEKAKEVLKQLHMEDPWADEQD